jgi:hypothetical protein
MGNNISSRIFDTKTRNLYRNLCKKIAEEHFQVTVGTDRNFNYLWFMYTKGVHAGEPADFMIAAEMNLLKQLDVITQETIDNVSKMLLSDDNDNIYMGLISIKSFRAQRIKKHGEWKGVDPEISPDFAHAAMTYSEFVTPVTTKISRENDQRTRVN